MSTSVSVALCTHNGMPYIEQQVASILAQTVRPSQIVLSDDASADDTVAAVRRAVKSHGRGAPDLVVLENPVALGVVANFEQAVRACTDDLIALCDQDDVWLPERLAAAVERFEADPGLLLLHGDARLVHSDGSPIGYSLFEAIGLSRAELAEIHAGREFHTLLRRNVVTGATTVFRRSLLDVALPFPGSWVHDEWIAMVASITGRTDALAARLIDYRQHGANQIGAAKPGLRDMLAQLGQSRTERGARLVARAEALVDRLDSLGAVSAEVRDLVERKAAHERRRRALPAFRPARIPGVIREARRGEYALFGRPRITILRDLLQPGA